MTHESITTEPGTAYSCADLGHPDCDGEHPDHVSANPANVGPHDLVIRAGDGEFWVRCSCGWVVQPSPWPVNRPVDEALDIWYRKHVAPIEGRTR